MKNEQLLKRLEGVQTISSIMSILNVDNAKAVYYVYRLRKSGYVKTARTSEGQRVYSISFENKLGGTSYEELINAVSPVKIATGTVHRVYGKVPSPEEVLVHAVKTGSLRTILAALAFFKKAIDWDVLYRVAKANHCERQIGAMYDLARRVMRTRRMSKRFRTLALPNKTYDFAYTVQGLKSKDFQEIENTWKVYLPFNENDLEAYT